MRAVDNYLKALENAEAEGEILGQQLTTALRKVIPDLEYSLGWFEAGIDTLCFWSEKAFYTKKRNIALGQIVLRVFPELEGYVETPEGGWLTERQAKRVRRILEKLQEES